MDPHDAFNKLTLLAGNHPADAVPAFNEAAACVEDLAINEDADLARTIHEALAGADQAVEIV